MTTVQGSRVTDAFSPIFSPRGWEELDGVSDAERAGIAHEVQDPVLLGEGDVGGPAEHHKWLAVLG